MMQNSGLGNAVSPLTSLTWTFRLPQLLIVTWRGQPGGTLRPTALADPRRLGPSERASRQEALREVVARTSPASTAVLASTGFCGRELYAISDRPNHLYMVGISQWLEMPPADGTRFARLMTRPGSPADLPRASITPVDVKTRLMQHFASHSGAS